VIPALSVKIRLSDDLFLRRTIRDLRHRSFRYVCSGAEVKWTKAEEIGRRQRR
jgi:hypothetical protein